MILKKIMLSMLFTALLFGESDFKKPESFKDYKKYTLDDNTIFLSPKLTKGLKIKDIKKADYDKDIDVPIKTMFFKINGKKVELRIDPGASEDYSFVFKYNGKETQIAGDLFYLSQSGTIYIPNRMNENYEVKRKFKITKNGIKEVKQAFLSVNLECKTSALATLYSKQGEKGNVVAKIPKGRIVKVLVNSFSTHNTEDKSKNYLVQTSFGLVGWVRSSAGYMQQKGKPLGCLMSVGD